VTLKTGRMELLQVPRPLRDRVFIQADRTKNSIKKIGDSEVVIDTAFEPHAAEHVTQEGVVLEAPGRLTSKKPIEVQRGDYVYTHHFLCDEDQQVELEGKKFYQLIYEYIHCKIKDGKITMVGDWNLIEPYEPPDKVSPGGIILVHLEKDSEPKIGIARHTTEYIKEMGVKPGDKIYFTKNSDYEMIVEGKTYWRMRDRDIIGIVAG